MTSLRLIPRTVKTTTTSILGFACAILLLATLLLSMGSSAIAQDRTQAHLSHYDELAKLPFPGGYPAEETTAILKDELAYQRAVQAYLWALPAINMYSMREGQRKAFDDDPNTLMIAKDRIDYKFEYTTGNPDVIYAIAWMDLKKDGPIVMDMPPKLQGLLDDMWHRPITDIGAAGPDKGKGGKYLVVPADYNGKIPDGYYVVKSPTHGVFIFLRAFLVDGKTDQGVALLEKSKIYPLSKANNPPKMKFPNLSGVLVPGDFPRDFEYFQRLADFINYETVSREDFAMRGMLAGLGIIKGKTFEPDARMKAILDKAAKVAFRIARTHDYEYYPKHKIYPGLMWEQIFVGGSPVFEEDTYLNLDALMVMFHKAYSTSKAMVIAMPGKGSQYLLGVRDADDKFLMGENAYRLHMPPNVPAANYWSVVVYDADTRGLLDNGQPFPSVASNQKMTVNKDGSTDIYFGPNAPKAANANWIKTVPGRGWFTGVRFYSPTQAFFDQSWKPGNIERIK